MDQEYLTANILKREKIKQDYVYVLDKTIFYVEGGGQLADCGTMNGFPVLRVYEESGVIYHLVHEKIDTNQVQLWIDLRHRYISRQGHSAQHLLSAALKKLYGFETISHHYDMNGSSIDLQTSNIDDGMLLRAEEWCNDRIKENRQVRVFYPDKMMLNQMILAHQPPQDKKVRIVEIDGIEYNPCKGLHIERLGELGMLVITSVEKVRGHIRVHYMSGEVLRDHIHTGFQTLRHASSQLSKPLFEIDDGIQTLLDQKTEIEKQLRYQEKEMANMLGSSLFKEALKTKIGNRIFATLNISSSFLSALINELSSYKNCYGLLVVERENKTQLVVFSSADSQVDCRQLFKYIIEGSSVRGGGQVHLCQGGTNEKINPEIWLNRLNMD